MTTPGIVVFSNNARATLAAPLSPTTTLITLPSGFGDYFPSPAPGQYFVLTLQDAATRLIEEITYCVSRTGDSLTVLRGQEGTTALSWLVGDICYNSVSAVTLAGFVQSGQLVPPGQPNFIILTPSGNLAYTLSQNPVYGGGLVSSFQPKEQGGALFRMVVKGDVSTPAGAVLLLIDSNTVPPDNTVIDTNAYPVIDEIPLASLPGYRWDSGMLTYPLPFVNGICAVLSTNATVGKLNLSAHIEQANAWSL